MHHPAIAALFGISFIVGVWALVEALLFNEEKGL